MAGDPTAWPLPQLVVDDQPSHHCPDREDGYHRQAKRAEGVGQLPDVGGHHGEGAGGQGGRQGPRQAGDQPPGAVGADHAGQQPGLAPDPGQHEPHIHAGIRGHDAPDRGRDPGGNAAARVLVDPAIPQGCHGQLGNQADDQLSDTLVKLAGAESGQRDQGDRVCNAGLGHDRSRAAAAGQVGQADRQIPAFPLPAFVGGLQEPVFVGEVEALTSDVDPPGHLVVEALGQQLGQLVGQLLGQFGGEVGVGQQADDHAVGVPGSPAIGCRHGQPFTSAAPRLRHSLARLPARTPPATGEHVILLVIPPGVTRPDRSALAGRPIRPELHGQHRPALGGRSAAVL